MDRGAVASDWHCYVTASRFAPASATVISRYFIHHAQRLRQFAARMLQAYSGPLNTLPDWWRFLGVLLLGPKYTIHHFYLRRSQPLCTGLCSYGGSCLRTELSACLSDLTLTSNGLAIPRVNELRYEYLGIFIVRLRNFKCSLTKSKKSFYRSANSVFSKIGRMVPELATLQLNSSKCSVFLYIVFSCFMC